MEESFRLNNVYSSMTCDCCKSTALKVRNMCNKSLSTGRIVRKIKRVQALIFRILSSWKVIKSWINGLCAHCYMRTKCLPFFLLQNNIWVFACDSYFTGSWILFQRSRHKLAFFYLAVNLSASLLKQYFWEKIWTHVQ